MKIDLMKEKFKDMILNLEPHEASCYEVKLIRAIAKMPEKRTPILWVGKTNVKAGIYAENGVVMKSGEVCKQPYRILVKALTEILLGLN